MAAPSGNGRVALVLAAAALGPFVLGLVGGLALFGDDPTPPPAAGAPLDPTTTTTSAPTTTAVTAPVTAPVTTAGGASSTAVATTAAAGPPPGLTCVELAVRRSFTYAQAHDYWQTTGRPARMDLDANGVPCESRYTAEEINAFIGYAETFGRFAPGLFCRDLAAGGASFAEAYRYWVWDGRPARMDADQNGVPCETVYAAEVVQAYVNGAE